MFFQRFQTTVDSLGCCDGVSLLKRRRKTLPPKGQTHGQGGARMQIWKALFPWTSTAATSTTLAKDSCCSCDWRGPLQLRTGEPLFANFTFEEWPWPDCDRGIALFRMQGAMNFCSQELVLTEVGVSKLQGLDLF